MTSQKLKIIIEQGKLDAMVMLSKWFPPKRFVDKPKSEKTSGWEEYEHNYY